MPKKSPAPAKAARKPAPPRVRGVKRPPMKSAFVGNFLDRPIKTKRKLKTNTDVAAYILSLALKDLRGVPITGPNPETDEMLSRMMATEIAAEIERGGDKSAQNWYTDAIRKAVQIAGMMQPEIVNDDMALALVHPNIRSAADARTVLFAAMAITSQNVPVNENMRYAFEQYRYFLAHGRFQAKGYGVKGSSIANNLKRWNHMLEAMEGDLTALKSLLDAEFTMRDLKAVGEAHGIRITSKEMLDEKVCGSIMFGPKIGAFYQNLSGRMDTLTADLWFCRTWGRYTGTLVREDVSPSQMERLAATLRADFLEYVDQMRESGLVVDLEGIEDMESDNLLDFCRGASKNWETLREQLVNLGFSNPQISVIKSKIGWPGAAESITKSLAGTMDQPGSGSRRKWMREVTARAVQILNRNGYDVSVAGAQAILWYPEKRAWALLAGRQPETLNVSYDEAMERLALKEGYSSEQVRAALHAEHASWPGPGYAGAAGPGIAGAVQGDDFDLGAEGRHQADEAVELDGPAFEPEAVGAFR